MELNCEMERFLNIARQLPIVLLLSKFHSDECDPAVIESWKNQLHEQIAKVFEVFLLKQRSINVNP